MFNQHQEGTMIPTYGNPRNFFASILIPTFVVLIAIGLSHAGEVSLKILCMERTPVIDGEISSGEWPEENMIRLSRGFHNKLGIRLYFAYDDSYLYLGAYVEDQNLQADGGGDGSGEYWEHYDDDAIEWYFDPDNSGGEYLTDSDRYLAVNIGNITDPQNGTGIVSRRSFNQGNGSGSSAGLAGPGELPSGVNYMVSHYGTVNDDSDTDTGYSIEVEIPWSAVLRTPPGQGDWMKINVIVISDDTGKTRDWSDNRSITPASARFTTPIRPDEYVELICSADNASQSGLQGPDAYIPLQFHPASDITAPGSVGSISVSEVRPYSVKLQWTSADEDKGEGGDCYGFEVKYSTSSINESNFSQCRDWPLNLPVPWSGGTASARVMGLEPNTAYYFAVRAYDEEGNCGTVSTLGPVTTSAVWAFNPNLDRQTYKGGIFPAPGGRYFMREDGANFIPVGHHLLMQDAATRYLYKGNVWTGSTLYDFSSEANALETVTSYLDTLKENGINTMRIFLEDFSLNVNNNANFNGTNGAYWIEFPMGTYNTAMGTFLKDLLKLCYEREIYLIISPFDTFYYDDYFSRTAWSSSNGGPLSDINEFFYSDEALSMCKARWQWVITQVNQSGYPGSVLGYEILNEWDSWEWTIADSDANTDAAVRVAFVTELAEYIRSLDGTHMIFSSTTALDPRGALGNFGYYSNLFDAALPHLYFPGNREPWNNPADYMDTAVVEEQSRAISWFSTNQLHNKPILNGEWGPSDGWMPDPSNPSYFSSFEESDDEMITTRLWFTELAGGAAGPGIRMQGGVRAYDYGLHLSDNMHGIQKTLSSFVENGSTSPIFDFKNFNSRFSGSDITVSHASVQAVGCSDGEKGLVYLNKNRNETMAQTISGSLLTIDNINSDSSMKFEFWQTGPDQTTPIAVRTGTPSDNHVSVYIPDFTQDLAVRYYPYEENEVDNIRINTSSIIEQGSVQTFSMNAVNQDDAQMYYRFAIVPNYGTAEYDPDNNYTTIQNFSSSNSVSYTFTKPGNYIVVVMASSNQGFSSGYQQIMGGSVSVVSDSDLEETCLQITGLDFSSGRDVKTGDLVIMTVQALNNCSDNTYYRFDLIPGYGTDEYDPYNNYTVIKDFSLSPTCSYKFDEAGSYIIVARASSSASLPSGAAPLIGGSINVTD